MLTAPLANETPDAPKSEDTALGWSLGGSLLGVAVAATMGAVGPDDYKGDNPGALTMDTVGLAALVALPSAGHWYAGDADVGPMVVRGAGAALMLYGITGRNDTPCTPQYCFNLANDRQMIGLLSGATLIIAGTVYDLVTAHHAAHEYNSARHLDVHLSPLVTHTTTGNTTGMALSGSF